MKLKDRAKKIKTDIPVVLLALKEKDTPVVAKVLAGIVLIYALSPIDLIPDFIPVLGYLDDLIILPGLIALTIYLIPEDVMERCRKSVIGQEKEKREKRWYYAIPFILFWVIIVMMIVKVIFL